MTLDEVRMLKKVGKAVGVWFYIEQNDDGSFGLGKGFASTAVYVKMKKKVYDEIKREYPEIHMGEPLVMAEGK